ncbi:MAG: hypothetical protein JW797_11770 [Bradymonadales bacterium]|nr:hypothetical protein [Bradymonadales bacterium]
METQNQRNEDAHLVEHAVGFLQTLFEKMGLAVSVEVSVEGRMIRVNVSGEEAHELVGGSGAAARSNVLEAIQLLLGRNLFVGEGGRTIVVDSDGIRELRCQLLEAAADRLAETAITTGKTMAIYGMNSFDRRAVHLRLANREEVQTDSEGEGAVRTLVVQRRGDLRREDPEPTSNEG